MNAQDATGIRELTAQEIDHVTGGVVTGSSEPWAVMTFVVGMSGLVATALGALFQFDSRLSLVKSAEGATPEDVRLPVCEHGP